LRLAIGFRLIDHQRDVKFFGQKDRVSFTPAELSELFIRQVLGAADFKPVGRVLNPSAHWIRCSGILQLFREGDRDYHVAMKGGQNFDLSDENQVIEG
jgi:hypothetical protein